MARRQRTGRQVRAAPHHLVRAAGLLRYLSRSKKIFCERGLAQRGGLPQLFGRRSGLCCRPCEGFAEQIPRGLQLSRQGHINQAWATLAQGGLRQAVDERDRHRRPLGEVFRKRELHARGRADGQSRRRRQAQTDPGEAREGPLASPTFRRTSRTCGGGSREPRGSRQQDLGRPSWAAPARFARRHAPPTLPDIRAPRPVPRSHARSTRRPHRRIRRRRDAAAEGSGLSGRRAPGWEDGKIAGYGVADRKTSAAATPDTVYEIASIRKQFIATGIKLLVREGCLRIDNPNDICGRLPSTPGSIDWAEPADAIAFA